MGLGNFQPEHIYHAQQRQRATEQLKTLGTTWIGPDLALENKVVVSPSQLTTAKLLINREKLPDIEVGRGTIASLDWSVRSFLAQSGIEIRFHDSNLSDDMIKNIAEGKTVAVPIDIINHGQRAVELEGEVVRFFWVDDSKRLRGSELMEAVKSGFVIDGEEDKDWFLGDVDLKNDPKGAVCVVVNLQDKKYYIPNAPEPLRIQNRKELPSVLKEIPGHLNLNFEIGETPKVKVGENIVAVINTGTYGQGKRHILSPLILGGEATGSEGHIRTEILHGMKEVEFFLYRK